MYSLIHSFIPSFAQLVNHSFSHLVFIYIERLNNPTVGYNNVRNVGTDATIALLLSTQCFKHMVRCLTFEWVEILA